MRYLLIVFYLLLGLVTTAVAQVSVSIGINLPTYPTLVRIPGYPVYYASRLDSNFFFYDGLYWVYQDDDWYASSWYNGPWGLVEPEVVPLFILRIPVRYYRRPPVYFHGWRPDAPPRWGDHWGRDWEQRRGGWDQWPRKATPVPAPLPTYQRRYSGPSYPEAQRQRELQQRNYRYQPREPEVHQRLVPGQGRGLDKAPGKAQDKRRDKAQDKERDKGRDKGRDKDDQRGQERR